MLQDAVPAGCSQYPSSLLNWWWDSTRLRRQDLSLLPLLSWRPPPRAGASCPPQQTLTAHFKSWCLGLLACLPLSLFRTHMASPSRISFLFPWAADRGIFPPRVQRIFWFFFQLETVYCFLQLHLMAHKKTAFGSCVIVHDRCAGAGSHGSTHGTHLRVYLFRSRGSTARPFQMDLYRHLMALGCSDSFLQPRQSHQSYGPLLIRVFTLYIWGQSQAVTLSALIHLLARHLSSSFWAFFSPKNIPTFCNASSLANIPLQIHPKYNFADLFLQIGVMLYGLKDLQCASYQYIPSRNLWCQEVFSAPRLFFNEKFNWKCPGQQWNPNQEVTLWVVSPEGTVLVEKYRRRNIKPWFFPILSHHYHQKKKK